MVALMGLIQMQRFEATMDVWSSIPLKEERLVGETKLWTSIGADRSRNLVWSYKANDVASGWRKEWTYRADGALTFQSYEVHFGDSKSRWILSRNADGWNLTGSNTLTAPNRRAAPSDASMLWFVEKKVGLGARSKAGAFDAGTLAVRNGEARYLRDETLVVSGKPVDAHVVERRFEDETQTWFVGRNGEIWRIDLAFPNAASNRSYRDKRLGQASGDW